MSLDRNGNFTPLYKQTNDAIFNFSYWVFFFYISQAIEANEIRIIPTHNKADGTRNESMNEWVAS